MVGFRSNALTTTTFSDIKSCESAGHEITEFINNTPHTGKAVFKCVKATGK